MDKKRIAHHCPYFHIKSQGCGHFSTNIPRQGSAKSRQTEQNLPPGNVRFFDAYKLTFAVPYAILLQRICKGEAPWQRCTVKQRCWITALFFPFLLFPVPLFVPVSDLAFSPFGAGFFAGKPQKRMLQKYWRI